MKKNAILSLAILMLMGLIANADPVIVTPPAGLFGAGAGGPRPAPPAQPAPAPVVTTTTVSAVAATPTPSPSPASSTIPAPAATNLGKISDLFPQVSRDFSGTVSGNDGSTVVIDMPLIFGTLLAPTADNGNLFCGALGFELESFSTSPVAGGAVNVISAMIEAERPTQNNSIIDQISSTTAMGRVICSKQ